VTYVCAGSSYVGSISSSFQQCRDHCKLIADASCLGFTCRKGVLPSLVTILAFYLVCISSYRIRMWCRICKRPSGRWKLRLLKPTVLTETHVVARFWWEKSENSSRFAVSYCVCCFVLEGRCGSLRPVISALLCRVVQRYPGFI
jgi:hypothetical protein